MPAETTVVSAVNPSVVPVDPSPVASVNFGDGRYSGLMREAYQDARRLTTMDDSRCEQFARDLGSDWGRTSPKVRASYGATSKDGRTTLKEVASAKGVLETKAITLGRLLSRANELKTLAEKSGSLEIASLSVKIDVSY